ncbi:YadA-like family protein [Gallibacterium anatis]|uniref:YadA-like family protein n=2 Tax=Gallibacterium anatis TaxID=750 RepID=UPI003004F4A3
MSMSNNKRKLIASAVTAGFVFAGHGVGVMADAPKATGYLSIANGFNAVASGNHSVAYGAYSSASGHESVAVGKNTAASGASAVAIGRDSASSGVWSTAVGPGSQATKDWSAAFGGKAKATGNNSTALGRESKASGSESTAVGTEANSSAQSAVAVGNKAQATASGAIAEGSEAKATGTNSVALGVKTEATGNASVAEGFNSKATADNAIALGNEAKASNTNTIAIGKSSSASNINSIAIGDSSKTTGSWGVALGPNSKTNTDWGVSLGGNSEVNSSWSTALGYMASVDKNGGMSVALGAQSKVKSGDGDVVSVGNDNLKRKIINVANGVNANDAVNKSQLDAVETKVNNINNKVDKGTVGPKGGQAIGAGSKANEAGALAVGNASEAYGYVATAVGYAHALDTYTVAMGVNAYAYNANGIAIGTLAKAGATDEDYMNTDVFDRIDPETGKSEWHVSPGGDPRQIRSGAIAIGNGAEAVGYRNTVIGEAAKAGIIIDRDAYNHPNKFGLGAVGATAIGAAAIAGGSQATVVGNGAVAEGKLSVGMGTRSYTTGKADTAVGTYSVVTEDSAVALGAYARADHKNSVALGNSSITEDVKATASTTINGKEYTFAGGDQSQVVGTVSIGGKGVVGYTDTTDKGHWNDPAHYTNGNGRTDMDNAIYRTITNVAAGRINADSTDAINGSQLYAVMGATEENRKLIENNTIKLAQTDHRINRRIDSVEEESRAGDAMNAALAALKPLQYDPNEKFQVMAGTGRFKDKQGFALGVAHHINENLLLNAGAAYSGSKYKMWNAGITYRFGSSNQKAPVIKVSNDEQRIRSLEQENMMLKQRLAAIEAKLSKLK